MRIFAAWTLAPGDRIRRTVDATPWLPAGRVLTAFATSPPAEITVEAVSIAGNMVEFWTSCAADLLPRGRIFVVPVRLEDDAGAVGTGQGFQIQLT